MAKPTSLPRWGETAGGSPAANISEPSSGQKDTGFTTNQIPTSAGQNWWQRIVYKWIQFWDEDKIAGVSAFAGPAIEGQFSQSGYWESTNTTQDHFVPLPLVSGQVLKSITWTYREAGNDGSNRTFEVFRLNLATGAFSAVAGWSVNSSAATVATVTQFVQDGTDTTLGADEVFLARFVTADTGDRFYGLKVTYNWA